MRGKGCRTTKEEPGPTQNPGLVYHCGPTREEALDTPHNPCSVPPDVHYLRTFAV